jgi:hypothetical protein
MPDESDTLKDAQRVADIANAVAIAKEHDPRRTAVGLLACMTVLIANDQIGRIALAQLMCEAAAELLSSVGNEYAVTVRRLN